MVTWISSFRTKTFLCFKLQHVPCSSKCNSPGTKLLYLSSGDPPPNPPNVEEIKTFPTPPEQAAHLTNCWEVQSWGIQLLRKNYQYFVFSCPPLLLLQESSRKQVSVNSSKSEPVFATFLRSNIFQLPFPSSSPSCLAQKHHFSFAAGKGVSTVWYGGGGRGGMRREVE